MISQNQYTYKTQEKSNKAKPCIYVYFRSRRIYTTTSYTINVTIYYQIYIYIYINIHIIPLVVLLKTARSLTGSHPSFDGLLAKPTM